MQQINAKQDHKAALKGLVVSNGCLTSSLHRSIRNISGSYPKHVWICMEYTGSISISNIYPTSTSTSPKTQIHGPTEVKEVFLHCRSKTSQSMSNHSVLDSQLPNTVRDTSPKSGPFGRSIGRHGTPVPKVRTRTAGVCSPPQPPVQFTKFTTAPCM